MHCRLARLSLSLSVRTVIGNFLATDPAGKNYYVVCPVCEPPQTCLLICASGTEFVYYVSNEGVRVLSRY